MIWCIAIMIAIMVASFLLMPSAGGTSTKPSNIDEMNFPTATAGKEIPVVFGTRWVTSPNVVWFGDLRTRPIRSNSGK